MELRDRKPARQLISLVPMIDVMLILLVFFMVTSTYLNLNFIPFAQSSNAQSNPTSQSENGGSTLLIRISADGQTYLRGQAQSPQALTTSVQTILENDPLMSFVLLPSGKANTQNLVSAIDILTRAGASRIRLVRLEAQQ